MHFHIAGALFLNFSQFRWVRNASVHVVIVSNGVLYVVKIMLFGIGQPTRYAVAVLMYASVLGEIRVGRG
jgi:2-hydroxy-3-keto-5-methylthiopentenyl-1-phosphate phosphatase